MKIKILKQVTIPGHGTLEPGTVLDTNSENESYVRSGFAEIVEVKAPRIVEHRDPVVETRDPVVESSKRKK